MRSLSPRALSARSLGARRVCAWCRLACGTTFLRSWHRVPAHVCACACCQTEDAFSASNGARKAAAGSCSRLARGTRRRSCSRRRSCVSHPAAATCCDGGCDAHSVRVRQSMATTGQDAEEDAAEAEEDAAEKRAEQVPRSYTVIHDAARSR